MDGSLLTVNGALDVIVGITIVIAIGVLVYTTVVLKKDKNSKERKK